MLVVFVFLLFVFWLICAFVIDLWVTSLLCVTCDLFALECFDFVGYVL